MASKINMPLTVPPLPDPQFAPLRVSDRLKMFLPDDLGVTLPAAVQLSFVRVMSPALEMLVCTLLSVA